MRTAGSVLKAGCVSLHIICSEKILSGSDESKVTSSFVLVLPEHTGLKGCV